MIPAFNSSGVLPPFLADPVARGGSPYHCALSEIHARFSQTPERLSIFRGLMGYRAKLRGAGIARGFQFIDGSYIEDCEALRGRPPDDIDVVTFAYVGTNTSQKRALLASHADLFDAAALKKAYHCHAYVCDLGVESFTVVRETCYWFGLFSHQRTTALWKGLLVVPLQSDDAKIALDSSPGGANAP